MKRPTPESDLKLMRRMDGLHFEHPFSGSRMLRGLLSREGYEAGRSQYERTGESRDRRTFRAPH